MAEVRMLSKAVDYEFPDDWYELAVEGHFWLEWRLAAFLRQARDLGLPLDAPWHGLDVGCGHGLVRLQLDGSTRWTTDGADLNENALRQNRSTRGDTMFYDIHDRNREFAARYDFIVLFDVLEHIADPHAFLDSVLYHLRPGGWLFLNVPAFEALRSAYDTAAGHLRRYDRARMRQELAGHPVDLRDMRYWGMSLVPLLLLRTVATSARQTSREIIKRGFEPPAAWVNRGLLAVMRAEMQLLRKPPFGTSLLAAAQRRAVR